MNDKMAVVVQAVGRQAGHGGDRDGDGERKRLYCASVSERQWWNGGQRRRGGRRGAADALMTSLLRVFL